MLTEWGVASRAIVTDEATGKGAGKIEETEGSDEMTIAIGDWGVAERAEAPSRLNSKRGESHKVGPADLARRESGQRSFPSCPHHNTGYNIPCRRVRRQLLVRGKDPHQSAGPRIASV